MTLRFLRNTKRCLLVENIGFFLIKKLPPGHFNRSKLSKLLFPTFHFILLHYMICLILVLFNITTSFCKQNVFVFFQPMIISAWLCSCCNCKRKSISSVEFGWFLFRRIFISADKDEIKIFGNKTLHYQMYIHLLFFIQAKIFMNVGIGIMGETHSRITSVRNFMPKNILGKVALGLI